MSTPNPPADGQDDAGQHPAPQQSPWSQPPAAPYGQPEQPAPPPVAPPMAPPVAPPPYGQQPPPGAYGQPPAPPYGQQPPADPYGQQQPFAPNAGYPANPANPYGAVALPKESYASWGQRAGAYLLDALLILPVAVVGTVLVVIGASGAARTTYDANGYGTTTASAGHAALAAIGYLIYLVGGIAINAWNRWYTCGKTGQSWGKKKMGLRLVRSVDSQPLGFGMAFVRDLAHAADSLICYVGWLFPLWDVKRQTIADKIVNSVVYPGVPKN